MPVDDLWFSSKRDRDADGKLLPPQPTKRHGRGKRYRVRWVDDCGQPRAELFERKADADRHDANVRADLSRGQYVDSRAGRATVAEHAGEWRTMQLHVDTTMVRVETAIRLHIAPTQLGRLPLKDVRRSHVQSWVKERTEDLSAATLRVVYSYLVSMFAAAVADRRIGSTPCVDIKLPEIDRAGRYIPGPEQVHALAAALPERLRAAVYPAAGCGLRIGETLGLELSDVNFLRREITVSRQLKVVTGRKPYLAPLKTKTSRRTLELPESVANPLARHIELFKPKLVEIDDETDPRRPVRRTALLLFTTEGGDPIQRPSWSRWWAAAAKEVGMPARWGYHGLRHYFATLLIHGGASVKTVQLALGHSAPTITLNTYVGEWPDALDRTRSLVDAALGKAATAAASASSRS